VKWIAIAAVVGVCAVAAVTASAQGTPPTKEPGKLIVGFDLPAPGFWNGRASGTTIRNPSGFEHSLSLAIARQLKIPEVEFLRSPFGGLFSPAPKKYDFAFEEVTITAARKKVVGFSTPYFDANQGVLIRKGLARPTRVSDLKSLQTCAQKDTTGLTWIRSKLRPAKQPLAYSASSTAAFDAVESGRCDALILDVPIVVSSCFWIATRNSKRNSMIRWPISSTWPFRASSRRLLVRKFVRRSSVRSAGACFAGGAFAFIPRTRPPIPDDDVRRMSILPSGSPR